MPKQSIRLRIKTLLQRVFFWLPQNEEIGEHPADHLHDHSLVLAVIAPERVPKWKQLRYAARIFSTRERRVLILASITACIALSVAGFWYFRQETTVTPAIGGNFIEALAGQPKYLNPIDAIANDVDSDIVKLIYSGLFKYEGASVVPDIAESYSWSDDGKVLTIKLRADARFHDGEPVTAHDIRFTYTSIQDPIRKNPMASLYRNVEVKTEDDHTVIFTLEHPDVHILNRLTLGILPMHVWGDIPVANIRLSDLNVKPIGSGPYRIRSFSRESTGTIRSYTLERFEQYYGMRPYIPTITLQFFPDKPSALAAFRDNQVDAVSFVSTLDAGKLINSSNKHRIRLELPEESVAFFNVKNSILSNKDVRKALILAIDRSDLVAALHNDAEPIYGPFPFATSTAMASDIDTARTLLTDAGWILPEGESVRVKKPKASTSKTAATTTSATTQEFDLTISVPVEPDLIAMAEALKRRWSLLGAKVTVQALPIDEVVHASIRDREHAMITLLNIFLGPEEDIFPFWWSGQAVEQGLNISGLSDRNLDNALELLHSATSTEALAHARAQATALIHDSAAAAFLVRPLYNYLLASDIQGTPERMLLTTPAERYQDIHEWYRKTVRRWR